CGNMTTGGTESILMAVYTAREYARQYKPENTQPEMIIPITAHPAFDKAGHYYGIKVIHAPVHEDFRVDLAAVRKMITPNTILLVGSAPSYPHGVIDPIEELSNLAIEQNLLLHVDACVGGFMLPFVKKLGYSLPKYDFELPGVTSISVDVHKYGYAAKGASVILYRNKALRRKQFFVYTEWLGGIYGSPTITGTRAGGAMAAAWAIIHHLGEEGYLRIADAVMKTTIRLKEGISQIDGLYIISNPEMSCLAFGSDKIDIYTLGDEMSLRGWHIDRQQFPPSLHLTVNYAHITVVDEFLSDLAECVAKIQKFSLNKVANQAVVTLTKGLTKILPDNLVSKLTSLSAAIGGSSLPKRTAAMYGMMGALPNRGDLRELILDFMDKLNEPLPENFVEKDK
ncbi:MAG: aminotransferase class V-fold PLP-dependent enzyme, partial [Bacteroidia bacterium]|nr:aminotransferase class V-fold PLP-dependent enzyme [Bacteroidia bacterium]